MSLQRFSITLLLLLALLSKLNAESKRRDYSHPCMGTVFYISLYSDDEESAQKAVDEAFKRIDAINLVASDYLPQSELSSFNRAPTNEAVPVSEDLFQLFALSQKTASLTKGAFDITAMYSVQLWRRAKRQHKAPTEEQIAHAVAMTDWHALQLDEKHHTATKTKPELLVDLGGIGKGYAANEALLVLKKHDFTKALVAGSGDLAIGDPPPGKTGWDVALRTFEKPEDKDRLMHVTLHNCGCSTSGDLHQFLELGGVRYSHIINPKTGLGLTNHIACTVIASDAAWSDALDTPMCVLGVTEGLRVIDSLPKTSARFVVLQADGTTLSTTSANFPAK